ncbi:MAG: VOC family protein [Acidobacteriaceae bacterium]|nr:VOC family protein [Acidobacteriaceae bacterium]
MIDRVDHLVLTVASVPATIEFYRRVLSLEAQEQNGRWSLHFGTQKLNLHPAEKPFEPKARFPQPGSSDFCLITRMSEEEIIEHLESRGILIEEGPVTRIGALGPMTSVYFRDPDGNLVEVATYSVQNVNRI